jgi:hypothetical protein
MSRWEATASPLAAAMSLSAGSAGDRQGSDPAVTLSGHGRAGHADAHIDLVPGTTTLTFFHSFAECR